MCLANVNSNQKGGGGTAAFKDLQAKVIEMAPPDWQERIRTCPFVPKTKGIHGAAIDAMLEEIRGNGEPALPAIQDRIQDGADRQQPEVPEVPAIQDAERPAQVPSEASEA